MANIYSEEMSDEQRNALINAGILVESINTKMSDLKIDRFAESLIYYDDKREFTTSFIFLAGIDWSIYLKINANKETLDQIKSQGTFTTYKEKLSGGPRWWNCEPNEKSIVSNTIKIRGDYNYVVLDYENNVIYQYCGTN